MSTSFSTSRIYRSAALTCVLLVIAVALVFVVNSKRETIAADAGTHASEDTRVADLSKIARLSREEAQLSEDIARAFQSATDTVAVIEHLESLGASSHVELIIRQVEKTQNDTDQLRLVISVDAIGGWENVYRFITELDTFVYKNDIVRIGLVKSVGEEAGSEWTASVEMIVNLVQQ